MVGLMLSVATIGCVKTDDPTAAQTGVLRLQLSNGEHSTRADGDAEDTDPLNEFKLATAQVFFLDASDNVLESHYVADLNAVQEETVTIPLSAEQLTDLFDDNGKGHVYVIANYGSEIDDTDDTTNSLAELKKLAIGFEETKETTEDGVEITHVATQSSFVMDSDPIEVTYDGQDKTISGEVPLTRAAAKIELTVNVAPLTQDGKTWTANTGAMTVTLHNGVKDGIVDDDSDVAPKAAQTGATLFNDSRKFEDVVGENNTAKTVTIDDVTYSQHVQTVPFYSYSTKWNAGDDDEVYLEVAIPWKVSTGSDESYQTFYYQVPVSINNLALVRNNFYQLTLTVGVLGGLTEPVTVKPSYTVIDWGSQTVNVNLSRPKYLVVDENYVVLNNLEEYSVGFQASDRVRIEEVSGTNTFDEQWTSSLKKWDMVYDFSVSENITVENGNINFSHQLDNTREPDGTDSSDRSGRYDYQSNTVTIRVILQQLNANGQYVDTNISEEITFVQNPAMYMKEAPSTGNAFVNKNTSTTSTYGHWWYVGSTQGMSANLITISVSAFDSSTAGYLITDPRQAPVDPFILYNINNSGEKTTVRDTAEDASGDNTLSGYRATILGEPSRNLVAPEFMMASAYGVYDINRDSSRGDLYAETSTTYRCAAYQESGYPAGRWRVPTPAELEVVGKLCSEGKLASIFYNNTTYASSDGPYTYNSDGTFSKVEGRTVSQSVRCVYDTWYWTDKCKTNSQFIWGAEGDIANGAKSNYLVSVQ